jgi:hypothetical protein
MTRMANHQLGEPPAPGTELVDRPPRSSSREPSPGAIGRVGGYGLISLLVDAPGAQMFEAVSDDGELALLQVARCREAKSKADAAERRYFEKRIADATARIASERALEICAHGAADADDGSRALFWAFPFREEMRSLGAASSRIGDLLQFVDIALCLARRLAARHALGRVEPLLSEQLIVVGSEPGRAQLIGAPVHVSRAWLAPTMLEARLAPEEIVHGAPKVPGDLFRLGQALASLLSETVDFLPPNLSRLLARLSDGDSARRIPRATEVIVELEALRATIVRNRNAASAPTVQLSALQVEQVAALILRAAADSMRCEPSHPPGDHAIDELLLQAEDEGRRAPTTLDLDWLPNAETVLEVALTPRPHDTFILSSIDPCGAAETIVRPPSAPVAAPVAAPIAERSFDEALASPCGQDATLDLAADRADRLEPDLTASMSASIRFRWVDVAVGGGILAALAGMLIEALFG